MIDVRELHIGAHILANGVRAKVVDINKMLLDNPECPYRVFVEGINSHGDKQIVGGFVNDDKIQPIPLTAELLTEIGLELTGDWGEYKIYTKQNITVRIVGERVYAKVAPNLGTLIDVKYLHELENFVYMTLHKELIED